MNILDIIFPKTCLWCRQVWQHICQTCKKNINVHFDICPICKSKSNSFKICQKCKYENEALQWIIIWFNYTWIIKKIIKSLKYKWARILSKDLINQIKYIFLSNQAIQEIDKEIIITYIPQDWYNKYFVRWFNQSYLLAKTFWQELNIPVLDVFQKIKITQKQARLNREKRIKNLNWAFKLKENLDLEWKVLIIIDDVTTTWSTIRQVSTLIEKKFNKTKVWWLVIARHI